MDHLYHMYESPYQSVCMAGSQVLPLLTRNSGLKCHLDIRFLRREGPGNIVGEDGDLDNRLKVLFDGLRAPHCDDEIDMRQPLPPVLYCLLEDDSLITKFTIEAQTLLDPVGQDKSQTYVELHVSVHVKATR